MTSSIDRTVDVCIVGSGLSGLTAAHRLSQAGIDVVVLEARDRIGGRTAKITTPGGRRIDVGGVYLGDAMTSLVSLVEEFGIETVPMAPEGASVRFENGERIVEMFPGETAPESTQAAVMEGFGAAAALTEEIPAEEPWTAERAAELDSMSLASWLEDNVTDESALETLEETIGIGAGGANEVSALFAAWVLDSVGGVDGVLSLDKMFRSSELASRMAAGLGDRVQLEAPVRRVEHGANGVTVHTDRGVVKARQLIVAIAPQLSDAIAWEPALPVARGWLQGRYVPVYGSTLWAFYDKPFWREEGLNGVGMGLNDLVVGDRSALTDSGGMLVALVGLSSEVIERRSGLVDDPEEFKRVFIETATAHLGPAAANPTEVYVHPHYGDPWSAGVISALTSGTLSNVGHALTEPVGPIHWAGAENSTSYHGWLEGAVRSAERAVGAVSAELKS